MDEMNRRQFLWMTAAIPPLMQSAPAPPQTNRIGTNSMFVSMHEASSARYDFKTAMEGYAKAGIRGVEPDLNKVREFAMKESPAAARRLLDDLGLKAVSSNNQLGLMEPGDQRSESLEQLKWKVELAQVIGADRLVTPSAGTSNYKEDDYKKGIDNMREAAEIAKPHGVTLMLEFTRTSRFAASLPTALKLVREVNHPNYRVMRNGRSTSDRRHSNYFRLRRRLCRMWTHTRWP